MRLAYTDIEPFKSNITIKTCKHCVRYFIPVDRQAEVYCDLTPRATNGKKCRELGARTTYAKNVEEVEEWKDFMI